jgi:NAD(P)-dependent dehydrogenase (short-subunit alcohol dehydrogenase family)
LPLLSHPDRRAINSDLDDLQWARRSWNGTLAYSDSKLQDVLLAFGIARCWPNVLVNAVEHGWVATRMGGAGATDDLAQGPVTQAWLAASDDPAARVSGSYLYHQRPAQLHPAARQTGLQDALLEQCRVLSDAALNGS